MPPHLIRNDVAVSLDRILFRQSLYNILTNSVEAIDENGSLEVSLSSYDEGSLPDEFRNKVHLDFGEQLLVTTISDDGLGIDNEHREKIFAPFFTTKTDGSGLGLAVAWKLVKAHGGDIILGDSEQQGTMFHILMPAKIEAALTENR
jgi:signal transduction histidine kinase